LQLLRTQGHEFYGLNTDFKSDLRLI
jgi:hypothetical protein